MSGNDAGDWCLIESDPGVFTELINGMGVQGVQVEELYSIDDEEHLEKLKPIFGLIFLFKWRQGEEMVEGTPQPDAPVYFAKQVITNACASQAIINLLLNINSTDVTLGNTLENFKTFTQCFDAGLRGLTLSNSEEIRKLHNSFSREHYMEMDLPKTKSEDNFHFITYVPIDDKIYELDGLRDAPIFLADIKKDDEDSSSWIDIVRPFIKRRIEKYTAGEIHFNLMALVPNLLSKYEQRIAELSIMEMDSDEVAEEISQLQNLIEDEKDKMKRYKIENNRRRHNYMPFLIELLKCLAKEGKLVDLVREAQEKKKKSATSPSKKKVVK